MKTCEETPLRKFGRCTFLRDKRIVILFFVAFSLIQYVTLHSNWQRIDEMFKFIDSDMYSRVLTFDDSKAENKTLFLGHGIIGTELETNDKKRMGSAIDLPSLSGVATNATDTKRVFNSSNFLEIRGNESFLWQGAQSRLCHRIKKKQRKLDSQENLHLSLVINCGEIDKRHQHGNYMIGLYAMKLAAMAFQANFSFRCTERERDDYILWWLQSQNAYQTTNVLPTSNSVSMTPLRTQYSEDFYYRVNTTLYSPSSPTPDVACRGMGKINLHYTSEYIRKDMRAMAVKLIPSLENKGILVDDVAIHLRCGDIISKNMPPQDKNYGLVHFDAYRKKIPSTVNSIGIVTAPFSEENRRKQDLGSGIMCRTLVLQLVEFLKSHFPNVEVSVRNDPNESIPEVASRLILAKHTFCVRSTFCLLPSIASFGTSYVQKGGIAYFVDEISKVYDDIKLIDEPFLLSHEIKERGFNSTLEWLTKT